MNDVTRSFQSACFPGAGRKVISRGDEARQNRKTQGRKTPPGLTAEEVILRLEEAGATLLAMPSRGYGTHMRQMRFDIVHTALEAYGWETPKLRAPAPSSDAITAMDETFDWLRLIPDRAYVLRRVLGARALVHPLTGRHLFTWRRLGQVLGADHKSVQRWHANAVAIIVKALHDTGN